MQFFDRAEISRNAKHVLVAAWLGLQKTTRHKFIIWHLQAGLHRQDRLCFAYRLPNFVPHELRRGLMTNTR